MVLTQSNQSEAVGFRAKYRELSLVLRGKIEAGQYRVGEQIPTEKELGETYDVSRNTIRQAIALLEEQGYLIRRRGSGTFVGETKQRGSKVVPLKKVGFLLVDLPLVNDRWSMQLTGAAHQWLASREIELAIAHMNTEDLVKGRQPGILRAGECQAVLADGWVSDVHCAMLEQVGLPYLILGNHLVSSRYPQARYAVGPMISRAVDMLQRQWPNRPVALFVEPLRLRLTHEIFEAYATAAQSLPQGHPILQVTEDAAADISFGKLLDSHPGPMSIIVTDMQWTRASAEYRRRGLSPREYPIVLLGDPRVLHHDEKAICHIIPTSGEHLINSTLPQFVDAYNAGSTSGIRIDVSVDRIEPPTSI